VTGVASWSSSNPAAASVGPAGRAIAVGSVGSTSTISAALGSVTGSAVLTVSAQGQAAAGVRSDDVRAFEQLVGPVKVVRIYHHWGELCDGQDEAASQEGEIPFSSFKAVDTSGFAVPYSSIINGTYDTYISEIAQSCQALGVPVWVSFNHEASKSSAQGTAADYQAAFDHWVTVFRAANATNVKQAVIYTNKSFPGASGYSTSVDASAWYPGDNFVDIIGDDVYNPYNPAHKVSSWVTVSASAAPFLTWAAPHAKLLALPEFASLADPADPNHRAQWINDATTWANSNGLLAVCYYDILAGKLHDYRIDNDPPAVAAFRAFAGN
jgi:hypothetical protein